MANKRSVLLGGIFSIALMLVLLLNSCDIDIYDGKRPIDYPNTVWVCEEIDFRFTVDADGGVQSASIINKAGETVEVTLLWAVNGSSGVSVKDANGQAVYFSGTCDFGKEQFTIHITDVQSDDFQLPDRLTLTCSAEEK